MGLSHYPSAAEGVLPVLVMNTVISVAILKSMVRWVLHVMGCVEEGPDLERSDEEGEVGLKGRRASVTLFKSLRDSRESCGCSPPPSSSSSSSSSVVVMECCVCLHGYEAEEEVSELDCKHFFHKGCLEKWLDHKHTTCPLCRSSF
ncbi:hypothetical protein Scep_017938 [Stephania cephalantha]|uniref:RING-type domain-containing protein n=1 Tax=Stephania cephalantha TaxID=152367 RepID=A0AAP0NW39_9MAGN